MKFSFCKILTTFIFLVLSAGFSFGQSVREKGIELYRQANYSEAIQALTLATKNKAFKTDGEVWNYLGLAYLNQDKPKDGRKALERAVKYNPQNSIYRSNLAYAYLLTRKTDKAQSEVAKAIQLDSKNANAYYIRGISHLWEGKYEPAVADADQAISFNKNLSAAYILKSDGLLFGFGKQWQEGEKPAENLDLLRQAADALENCLSGCQKDNMLKIAEEKLETVKAFLDYFKRAKDNSDNQTNQAAINKTPLTILSKAKPRYTDSARQSNVEGTIDLAVLFGSDGKIKHIIVLKGLGYGLDQQAVIAARMMTFEPQTENGKPVSVVRKVRFNFDIY